MLPASLIGYGSMISGWIGVGFFHTGGNVILPIHAHC